MPAHENEILRHGNPNPKGRCRDAGFARVDAIVVVDDLQHGRVAGETPWIRIAEFVKITEGSDRLVSRMGRELHETRKDHRQEPSHFSHPGLTLARPSA